MQDHPCPVSEGFPQWDGHAGVARWLDDWRLWYCRFPVQLLEGHRSSLSVPLAGGRALVTVWATEQEGMARKLEKWAPLPGSESEANDYLVPWHVPMHRAEAAAAAARPSAVLDGKKSTVCFQRYYHLFRPGELEGLVRQVPGAQLLDAFYDKDNWCVVFGRL